MQLADDAIVTHTNTAAFGNLCRHGDSWQFKLLAQGNLLGLKALVERFRIRVT